MPIILIKFDKANMMLIKILPYYEGFKKLIRKFKFFNNPILISLTDTPDKFIYSSSS